MSTKNKVPSYFCQDLIDGALSAAVNSPELKALMGTVEAAGKVEGAKPGQDEASSVWHALADKLSAPAAYAASFDGPITTQFVSFMAENDHKNSVDYMVARDALPENASDEDLAYVEDLRLTAFNSASGFQLLIDFRILCGVVSHGVKAAQAVAYQTAKGLSKLAESAKFQQRARDQIMKVLERDLKPYGLKINFQTVTATTCEVPASAPETDASKAEKSLARAFKLDPSAAIKAILELDSMTLATIKNAIERAQKKAAKNTTLETIDHLALASDKFGKMNPETGKPFVTDLLTMPVIEDQSALAAQRLADIEAKGVSPELLAMAEKANQKATRRSASK